MWRRRLSSISRSLSRSRKNASPSQSNAQRSDHADDRSESSTRLSRADTLLGSATDVNENPLGLSVVYSPEGSPCLDIIFVHGLGGASIKTWCHDGDQALCWPRSWLPLESGFSKVRILSFGYDATVLSRTRTIASISAFAKSLLAEMKYAKGTELEDLNIGKNPIIFVAHSMGGLVVKKAYLRGLLDNNYQEIVTQMKAIVFLSTPHRGSSLAKILDSVLSLWLSPYAQKSFIKELAQGSSTLAEINEDFRHVASNLELYSFYELQETPLGSFKQEMIVDQDSSVLGYSKENSIPLNADHHGVCKFPSPEDSNYRSVLSVLKTVIDSSLKQVEELRKAQSDAVLKKVNRILSSVTNPQEDLAALQDRLTPGTCQELLTRKEVQNWISSSGLNVLWMNGKPGSGKSCKAAYLITHLKSMGYTCHYFFFKHDDAGKRTASSLFRSLVHQAIRDVTEYRNSIQSMEWSGKQHAKLDDQQFWTIFLEPLLFKCEFPKPLFWIFDAIDESDSVKTIISQLAKVSGSTNIRILITGRQHAGIIRELSRLHLNTPLKNIDVNENVQDIRLHLESEASSLGDSFKLRARLVNQIVQRANGSFLWASLAMKECLDSHSQEDMQRALDEMPAGMEALYKRMESNITKLAKASDRILSKTILTWATFAKRPLHRDELLCALESEHSIHDLSYSINQLCGNFVIIDASGRVSLVHQTAREYLMHSSNFPFTFNAPTAHEELFVASLHFLFDPQLRNKLEKGRLPVLCDYALGSWAYHLERTSADSENALSDLVVFLGGSYVLSWIELAAYFKKLKDLVFASTVLATFVRRKRKKNQDKNPLLHRLSDLKVIEMWAYDLLKIVGKFGGHLLQNPSAIYRFVPQFCPAESGIHKQFSKSLSTQLSVSGVSNLEWDDLMSRLSPGTSTEALMATSSFRHIAVSTSKHSISLYDASSFENAGQLHQGEHIHHIAFSKSGHRIASYGIQKTKIWHTSNGDLELCFDNLNESKALEFAFVDDDKALFLCSDLREIQKLSLRNSEETWKKQHGEIFQDSSTIAGGVRNSPSFVKLSSDATQLAVAYRGSPLEAWDLQENRLLRRCKRRRDEVTFSQVWTGVNRTLWHPINGEILGIYTDGTVFKWHPYTESHIELPTLTDGGPAEIQISANGSVFATSDNKGCVRLYNYEEFSCIYQLSSEDNITGLCFTLDGRRFIDTRGSYCNIWEPNALIRLSELDERVIDYNGDTKSLSEVSFTASEARAETPLLITRLAARQPDLLISSGDSDGKIVLYEPKGNARHVLDTSTRGVEVDIMTWSRDGRYLAFEDFAGTITVLALEKHNAKNPDFPWRISPILRVNSEMERSGARQLLISSKSDLLLLADKNEAEVWDLQTHKLSARHKFPAVSFRVWCNHHLNNGDVLVFKAEDMTLCTWTSKGLQPKKKWTLTHEQAFINEPTTASRSVKAVPKTLETVSDSNDLSPKEIEKISVTSNGRYILLFYARSRTMSQQSRTMPLLRFIRTDELDTSESTVRTSSLPKAIASLMERPFTVIAGNLLVFIDTTFWICTWRMDTDEKPNTTSDGQWASLFFASEHDASSISADHLAKLGVTRHFALPRDWVSTNSLSLCTVLDDGTFLCPRKGEVAIIRSGLGSEW